MAEEADIAKFFASHGRASDFFRLEALSRPPTRRVNRVYCLTELVTLRLTLIIAASTARRAIKRLLVILFQINHFFLVGGAFIEAPAYRTYPTSTDYTTARR